jgi:hypothetical protein
MPVKEAVKPRNERTRKPDCYIILLPTNKLDAIQRLEEAYKKIITNNEIVKPIKVVLPTHEEFNFQLPIELRGFILGMMVGEAKWHKH